MVTTILDRGVPGGMLSRVLAALIGVMLVVVAVAIPSGATADAGLLTIWLTPTL